MQEIKLTVAGDNAPIPLRVESGKIIHDGGLPDGGTTGQVLTKISDQDGDADWQTPSGGAVQDVQVNGVSVLTDGVANIPEGAEGQYGVYKLGSMDFGLGVIPSGDGTNILAIATANSILIKAGRSNRPINASQQYRSVFYGLAKAAGDSTQSQSDNAVGTYTDEAKSAISTMLNGPVTVSGTTPTITALPGVRYVCGEVSTITINTPESGIVDVVFTSGSTPTVLTVTPPSGMTMKWANGFDTTSLEADTVYEVNIMDGCLGVAGTWN